MDIHLNPQAMMMTQRGMLVVLDDDSDSEEAILKFCRSMNTDLSSGACVAQQ